MCSKIIKYSYSILLNKTPNDVKINLLNYLKPINKINFITCNKELYILLKKYSPKFIELILLIDTTASIHQYEKLINKLFLNFINKIYIKNICRVSVILFKDYYNTYTTKVLDFTTNYNIIKSFLNDIEYSGGEDIPEAIEKAFEDANNLNYYNNFNKQLFLVTDSYPHGFDDDDSEDDMNDNEYRNSIQNYTDWKQEFDKLNLIINDLHFIDCNMFSNSFLLHTQFMNKIINYDNKRNKNIISFNNLEYYLKKKFNIS